MITATEAKVLYDQSGAEVDSYLKHEVESKIVKAAMEGKRSVIIHLGALDYLRHLDQEVTPIQKAVVTKLKELKYRAVIQLYGDQYVPRGLADDDGRGPSHRNYGLEIGW